MLLDLHIHLTGHRDRKATAENIRQFLEEARNKHLTQIGFADHDLYWDDLNFDLVRQVAAEYPELQVRIGLEVDYRESEEARIAQMSNSYPFDYLIGSVHQLDGWLFDFPGEESAHRRQDADQLYARYFSAVEKAAGSGLFDMIGHFDLIKLFGVRPKTDVRLLAAGALAAVSANHLVLEINTNGRYKPVGEFYPEFKLIQEIQRRGIPFTLGSDAHAAGAVGRDLAEAGELLRSAGVKSVVGFNRRRRETFCL